MIMNQKENPSLKPYLPDSVIDAYSKAVQLATQETRLPINTFPREYPYSLEKIWDDDFYPEN
jgi:hypothetical protein